MPTPRPFNAPTGYTPNISPLGEVTRQVERMKALTETAPKPAPKPGFNPMDWLNKYTQSSKPKAGPTPAKPMPPKAGPTKPNIPGAKVVGGLARAGGLATAISPDKSIGPEERALGATMAINPLLGTAVAAGAGIGKWMQENFAVNTAGSGRGAGRSSFNPAATAQPPEGSRGLPADYKETEQQAGKTAEDFRPGAGFRDVSAPNGNDASGTRTGPAPMTMEDANKILNRGGLEGKGYEVQNPFTSTQLPTSSASLYKGDGSDISYSKELPENMFIQESDLKLSRNAFDAGSGVEYGQNLVQMPASGKIEYEQKAGAPLTVSSGTLKVTEANESAQQPEVNVDMARRRAFLDGDLNSMEALRAIEAQKGIVVTGNTYNVVNPNAGKEGENDFIKIDKAQRDTIMRGGEGAQNLLNSYVTGIKAEGQSLTSPAPENFTQADETPTSRINTNDSPDIQIQTAPEGYEEHSSLKIDRNKFKGAFN